MSYSEIFGIEFYNTFLMDTVNKIQSACDTIINKFEIGVQVNMLYMFTQINEDAVKIDYEELYDFYLINNKRYVELTHNDKIKRCFVSVEPCKENKSVYEICLIAKN